MAIFIWHMYRKCFFATILITVLFCEYRASAQQTPPYLDVAQPLNARVDDLIRQLTLAEKALLLGYKNEGVSRLFIPAYNWWNEGLHGVARAGEATVFPQAIALAATFNDSLLQQIGTAISAEARV